MRWVIDVKPHERSALLLSFLYFFCLLAAYYVIRPVRDQLGAVGGSASLVLFYVITFAVTLFITPVFGALVARLSRKRFVPVVYLFFICCLIAFVPLFQKQEILGARLLGSIFFVWVSVFNLFVVSVFWSFMADIFSAAQARRLFAPIAIGGTVGAVLGPLTTSFLVVRIGVPQLLLVSSALLAIALVCVFGLNRWSRRFPVSGNAVKEEAAIGGSLMAGAKQLLTSPFLRHMAILMLLGDAVGTVLYGLVADYVKSLGLNGEARTALYANLDLVTNGLVVLMQATLTRWLLWRHGPTPALVLPAAINFLVLLVFAFFGGALVLAALVITRAGAYGIFKPASDSLYTRVEREVRYKGKNFVDTAVWRFGDLSVISLLNGFRALGLGVPQFALFCAGAAAISGWVGWRTTHAKDLAPEPPNTEATEVAVRS